MTSLFSPAPMRQKSEPNRAELLRVSAAGLPVTSRSCCRRIRAFSPSIPNASRPRPARDIRTSMPLLLPLRDHAKLVAALARRREHPGHSTVDDAARACACVRADTTRCTSADVSALSAQAETIVDIPYNTDADLMAPSPIAYRDPDRSGSRWVISDEHTRVISREQRRTRRSGWPPAANARASSTRLLLPTGSSDGSLSLPPSRGCCGR